MEATNTEQTGANSIDEVIPHVLRELTDFAPDTPYDSDHVGDALRGVLRSRSVQGTELMPDLKSLRPPAVGHILRLLVLLTCDKFVEPAIASRRAIPQQQKEYVYRLRSEIHRLENGEEAFAGSSR